MQGFHFQMDQLQRQGLMFLLDKPSGSILLHFYCFIITVLSTIFLEAKAPLRIAFLSALLSQKIPQCGIQDFPVLLTFSVFTDF